MTDSDVDSDGGHVEASVVEDVDHEVPTPLSGPKAAVRIGTREYSIAIRGRWAVGLATLFAVFSVAVVVFGTAEVGPSRYGSVIASLVELSVYLVPLAALSVGYDTVVGAEETGALDMLFALPVSQAQVIVGKYLGRAAVLCGAMIVGLAVGGFAAGVTIGFAGLGQYAIFVLAAVLTAAAFLAISVLLSTLASAKTQALGAALVAWLWFVLLHDLVALGLIASMDLPDIALTVMVLANPADIFRLLVLSQLDTTTGGFAAVLTAANLSTGALVASLLGWLAAPLGLSVAAIRRRS